MGNKLSTTNPDVVDRLLLKRGIQKDSKFGDYQDFIEDREKTLRPIKLDAPTIVPSGSMHIALGRLFSNIGIKI